MEIRATEDLTVVAKVNDYGFSKKITRSIGKFIEKISRPIWEKALAKSNNVQVYYNHMPSETLAESLDLRCEEDGVWAYIKLKESAREVYNKVQRGDIYNMSFGFRKLDDEIDETRKATDGFFKRYIKDFLLYEISLLSVDGAYPNTEVCTRSENGEDIELEVRELEIKPSKAELDKVKILDMMLEFDLF